MPMNRYQHWHMANSDPHFLEWLSKVDDLCLRFLDVDLSTLPEAQEEPCHPFVCYEDNMDPEIYFLSLVTAMKISTPGTDIDRQVARMAKWGLDGNR